MWFERARASCAAALAVGIVTAGVIALASLFDPVRSQAEPETVALGLGDIGMLAAFAPEGFVGSASCATRDALARAPFDVDLLSLALNEALQSGDMIRARDAVSKLTRPRSDDAELARLNASLR